MSADNKEDAPTLAEALDATEWDFVSEPERKLLLRPVGSIFENLPWEVRPQYLGPAPVGEAEVENEPETDSDDGSDTQPVKPLER
jgi:hypothetical protein